MVEKEQQPTSKKRRLRAPTSETVRDQAKKARDQAEKPVKKSPLRLVLRQIFKPLKVVLRPIGKILLKITPKYFRNAFNELRQVTWPNRKQSRQMTTAVVVFSIFFAVAISFLDYGLNIVFKKVFLKE
ncbi:MAG: preprotein translocase subunit SecE [Candidatus Saccharimonadales bacterium]